MKKGKAFDIPAHGIIVLKVT
ncbi:hypothetical protein [Pedobacter arcticus]|nr:hypothetical protein [Pedobacter arcticus]